MECIGIKNSGMQWDVMQCNQYNGMYCNVMEGSGIKWNLMQCNAMEWNVM
jgi:5-deoxy-D-glucuronate isomerase